MKVSVTIISYNQIAYLRETIESVLCQTLRPANLLIIDDCSTDGSRDLVLGYRNDYPDFIDAVVHDQNRGVIYCRNEALRACKGDAHMFLDGDDRFLAGKVELESALMDKHGPGIIVYSNINYIDKNGRSMYTWSDTEPPVEGDIFASVFAREFPRGNLFRSELVGIDAYRQVGCFDVALDNLYEDFDMRIRLAKRFKAVYCDRVLSEYRIHGRGLSSREKREHLAALKHIYSKNICLLEDLPREEAAKLHREFRQFLGDVSLKSAIEAIRKGKLLSAARYSMDSLLFKTNIVRSVT